MLLLALVSVLDVPKFPVAPLRFEFGLVVMLYEAWLVELQLIDALLVLILETLS